MEVQGEGLGLPEQQAGQAADPAGQEGTLLRAVAAVGVLRQEGLLGQHVEASEQAQGLVEVEVIDVAAPLLV
jgi:hypothetical protein